MLLTRYRPEERFSMERVNRVLDELTRSFREGPDEMGSFSPSVNIYEKNGDLIVEAELPGVKKEDIDVRIENGVLTLKGERKEEKEVKKEDYYRQERFFGSFLRTFQLPTDVSADTVEATFKDGLLTVKVPRSAVAKPKRISIR